MKQQHHCSFAVKVIEIRYSLLTHVYFDQTETLTRAVLTIYAIKSSSLEHWCDPLENRQIAPKEKCSKRRMRWSSPIDLIALLHAESVMIRSTRNSMYLSSSYEKAYVVVSQRVFRDDVFNIPNRKIYSDRKSRMNEMADHRYCSTKINQAKMF